MSKVLVTGGSGFIAGHAIVQLLAAGHQVRATVRDLRRASDVRATLASGGAHAPDTVSFVAATLEGDAGWTEAVTAATTSSTSPRPFRPARPSMRTT